MEVLVCLDEAHSRVSLGHTMWPHPILPIVETRGLFGTGLMARAKSYVQSFVLWRRTVFNLHTDKIAHFELEIFGVTELLSTRYSTHLRHSSSYTVRPDFYPPVSHIFQSISSLVRIVRS